MTYSSFGRYLPNCFLLSESKERTSKTSKVKLRTQEVVKFGHVIRAQRSDDSKVTEDNGSDGNSLSSSSQAWSPLIDGTQMFDDHDEKNTCGKNSS